MIKHINNLIRFDFTNQCRNCEFKKELNQFEYCCSFVYDIIEQDYLYDLKKQILDFIFFEDKLEKIDYNNILFTDDTEYGVMVTFKTNLKTDKKLILKELRKSLLNSNYFNNVNFLKNTLYKKSFNEDVELIK